MKSLRDATILLGLLLLLTSVKITPTEGEGSVMPVTRAGLAPVGQSLPEPAVEPTAQPAADRAEAVFPAGIELETLDLSEIDIQFDLDDEHDCNGSLIVIQAQVDGEPLVLKMNARGAKTVESAPRPRRPARPESPKPAMQACSKG